MEKKILVRRQREVIELLLKEKLITREQLDRAREETKRTGLTIERALAKLGVIRGEQIVKVRANALGIPYVDLSDYKVDEDLIKTMPEKLARKFKAIPLFKINNSVTVGMTDPQDIYALDQVRRILRTESIEPVLVSESGLERVLDRIYGMSGSIEDVLRAIDDDQMDEGRGLVQAAEEAPIIKLVNLLITQAMRERASDIHIEPEEDMVRIRFRIDGVLHEVSHFPKKLQGPVSSRVKILSTMDISESRKPQDGRIRMAFEDRDLDLRVSTFPTIHGENLVLRLLDKTAVLFGPKELGFLDEELNKFEQIIRRPNGIVLVTGPTGSGKTSTLYAALTAISTMEKNIVTIEDPVEFELPLIRQTQVNPKAGITFANGLRNILRQDPDIIMVGEIRDRETVEVAIQAALTGHLVLATLHTNDAPSALTRLMDMGVEPFLIASAVTGIVAQRLVKVVCGRCHEPYSPPKEMVKSFGAQPNVKFFHGKGCGQCRHTGYHGRTGIFEVLSISDEIRKMIHAKQPADMIRAQAVKEGMRTLKQDGLIKAQKGITGPEEVIRVTEIEV